MLLFGGAIQLAGEVKARGDWGQARSDWIAIERERGISVSSAVMSFDHQGRVDLLDTPRHRISAHWDFSDDTYCTLTAFPYPSIPRLRGRDGWGIGRRQGHRGADPLFESRG